jgi:hypothetical protein
MKNDFYKDSNVSSNFRFRKEAIFSADLRGFLDLKPSFCEKLRKKSAGIAVTFHNHTGSPLEPID